MIKIRKIVEKEVKLKMPHCNVCGEMLEKEYKKIDGWGDYHCSCGVWHWVTNIKTGEQYYIILFMS